MESFGFGPFQQRRRLFPPVTRSYRIAQCEQPSVMEFERRALGLEYLHWPRPRSDVRHEQRLRHGPPPAADYPSLFECSGRGKILLRLRDALILKLATRSAATGWQDKALGGGFVDGHTPGAPVKPITATVQRGLFVLYICSTTDL